MWSGRMVIAVVGVLMTTAGCAPSPIQPRGLDAAALDGAITRAMREARIPGAMIGIWSPQGEYVKAFGVADTATGAPMRTDFHSRIGSVTKTFTATAVLQLAGQHRLGLDDPISRHLDGVPGGEVITVRQLATMRSGLPDYLENPEFQKAVMTDPARGFTPAEMLAWAFAKPSEFTPGQRYQYSNTNYILLGLLIEKVTGQRLPDYLDQHIFGPLSLSHTSFPTGTQFPYPHAQGYTDALEAGGAPVDATNFGASYTWAAGAVISTLADMRIWLPALANGSLLTPDLQEQRLQSPPVSGLPDGIGYGIGVLLADGWIGHNGSVPGYQTVAIELPERSMTVVIMINTDITPPGEHQPSTALGKAITTVLTPDHVYDV